MRVTGKIRLLLSSVLCAGLLVSAFAVPQASASYSETYSFNLAYSNLSTILIYSGTSLGDTSHLVDSTSDIGLTTMSYYHYQSTDTLRVCSVVYEDSSSYSTSSLPPGTDSTYTYPLTAYRYSSTTPITTGDSDWSFYVPRTYSDAYYAPSYMVTYYSGSILRGNLAASSFRVRLCLLNVSGAVITSSDWVQPSTSTAYTLTASTSSPVYGVRIDVACSTSQSAPPATCWLGQAFFASATLSYTDLDASSYYEDVIDGLDSIDSNITESTNSIIDNLLSLPSMIIDGILGLFVPSADDLSDIYDDFTDLMEEKLGAIWQVGSIISSFFDGLSTDEEANTITFPGISFPMNGELVTIASAQSVQIVPDEIYNADWYDMVRLAVTAVLVFAWVMGMEKMLERMLSPDGRSED